MQCLCGILDALYYILITQLWSIWNERPCDPFYGFKKTGIKYGKLTMSETPSGCIIAPMQS